MRRAAMALACAVIAGCSCGGVETGIDLTLVADATVASTATEVQVTVRDDEGAAVLARTTGVASLPIELEIGADGARGFDVEAWLRDAAGTDLARVAARGDYIPDQRVVIGLRFEDACAGMLCTRAETCTEGRCVDSCALPPCAPLDAAPDAGP